jgi:sigma-B regulation protein RsbU (phosphoserine phosphatase)
MNEFDPPGYDDVAVISISVDPDRRAAEPLLTSVWAAGAE